MLLCREDSAILVGVWRSSDFTESKKPYLFTPQGRMEIALFRLATLTLAHRMPSVMNQGAEPLESHSRTPGLLGGEVLHYFTFFPSPHAIFSLPTHK